MGLIIAVCRSRGPTPKLFAASVGRIAKCYLLIMYWFKDLFSWYPTSASCSVSHIYTADLVCQPATKCLFLLLHEVFLHFKSLCGGSALKVWMNWNTYQCGAFMWFHACYIIYIIVLKWLHHALIRILRGCCHEWNYIFVNLEKEKAKQECVSCKTLWSHETKHCRRLILSLAVWRHKTHTVPCIL